MPGARRLGAVLIAALALGPLEVRAAPNAPGDVRDADALAAQPPSRERDRLLERWAMRAPLVELLFVLRRSTAELGRSEAPLVRAALANAPRERVALRRHLASRLVLVARNEGRRALAKLGGMPSPSPRASVFRIAALLPDSGNYEADGRAVRLGIEVGLSLANARAALPIGLRFWPTGDDQPARAAAAFDSAAASAGAAIGERLPAATSSLAAASHRLGIPLVTPVAMESLSDAPATFQIGPSATQRGHALAHAVLESGRPRVGMVIASGSENSPFVVGFTSVAESLQAPIVRRTVYESGNLGFAEAVRALRADSVQVLFWDGEARELEALVRQLAQDRVRVRLCGGADLDPERHHGAVRPLLSGARYVGLDWHLPWSHPQALLDSVARQHGEPAANRYHVGGYLAARLIAAAVAGGAWCPEELSASLATRVSDDRTAAERSLSYRRGHGFFDWQPREATLPIYEVTKGRARVIR